MNLLHSSPFTLLFPCLPFSRRPWPSHPSTLKMCPNWRTLTNSSKLALASKTPTGIFFTASSPNHSKPCLHPPSFVQILPGSCSIINIATIYKKCVVVNAALSCADLRDSCVIPWKSVISWVGWGNQWDVAYASWNRACMATLMPNTVENVTHDWYYWGWNSWFYVSSADESLGSFTFTALTACGIM